MAYFKRAEFWHRTGRDKNSGFRNVNGKDRLCAIPGTFTPIDHPSHEDVVSAVQDFFDAVAEKDKAEVQCRNLGLEP